jgi:plastocyanin
MEQKHIDEMEEDTFLDEELIVDDNDAEEYPVLNTHKKRESKPAAEVSTPKAKPAVAPTPKKKEEEEISIKPAKLDAKLEVPIAKEEPRKEIREKEVREEKKEDKREEKKEENKITPTSAPSNDPDKNASTEEPKKSSWWKWVIAILLIILIAGLYTNWFGYGGDKSNNQVINPINENLTSDIIKDTPTEVKPTDQPITPTSNVAYTLEAKKWMFNPNTITVKTGAKVSLTISPVNMELNFAIPEMNLSQKINGDTKVEFVANKAGTYKFICSDCDEYRGMEGNLIVK